jgi:ribonuclease HI
VQVVVHVDGGARGNPGPAAAAAVVSAPDGRVLDEAAVTLGHATNNVAEYRGLLLGLERAAALGATAVDIVNDSELVAKQVNGDYRVKHADLKPLHAQAREALGAFERWSIRSVPRAENAAADALVNQALDGEEVAPGPPTPEVVTAGGTDYATYLLIDDLLQLQRPITPGAHDELLFIVVHQAYELWFKLILHELTTARDELADGRPHAAAPRLRRVVAVWRLLLSQLEVLETMGPEGFLEFRDPLAPASGFRGPAGEIHPRARRCTRRSRPGSGCRRSARRALRRSPTSIATTPIRCAPPGTTLLSCSSTTTKRSAAGATTTR